MKQFLTVESSLGDVEKALSGTKKSFTTIRRQALGIIGRGTSSEVKKSLKAQLVDKSRTKLLKAQVYHVKKDGSEVNVYPRAYGKQNWAVGLSNILNYGAMVGKSRTAEITPRCFIQAGERYADSGSYDAALQKMVDRELKKYWG